MEILKNGSMEKAAEYDEKMCPQHLFRWSSRS